MRANDSTRRDPMLPLIAGVFLLACCAGAAVLEKIDPIEPRHLVAWRTPEEARRVALETHRPILFAFVKERDLESSRFEHDLFADAENGRRINRQFVGVRVVDLSNAGRRNTPMVAALLSQFAVQRLPALVVSDADGNRHEILIRHRSNADTFAFLEGATRSVLRPAREPKNDAREAYIEALAKIGGASSPTLSPDAKRVAFVSDLSGQPQLWAMDVDGGFPELVASTDDGIHAAQWSRDGQWIAFASGTRNAQIFVVRPDGRDLRQVTNGTGRNVMTFWTDDNLLPLNVARPTTGGMESALYDPVANTSRVIATHPQFGVVLDVACGGKRAILLRRDGARRATWIATGSATRELFSNDEDEQLVARFAGPCSSELLAVTNRGRDKTAFVRMRGNAREMLWSRDDAELTSATLTRDRSRAAVVWNHAGTDELGLLDLRTGQRELVPLPVSVIGAASFSNDGTCLVFAGGDARQPSDVWLLEVGPAASRLLVDRRRPAGWRSGVPAAAIPGGEDAARPAGEDAGGPHDLRRLTRSAHAGVDLARLVVPELVQFRASDGLALSGWLYRAATPGRAVISLHGGPAQQETAELNPTYQALVAAGISVFAPNIRGSFGFGRRFVRLDDGERRENAIGDVKAAAEMLVARGIATPRHLGVMGESYGGWLTLAVTTRHPELFAAAVDQYGMLDLKRMTADAIPEVAPMLRAEYGGDALLERFSIDRRALRTPTLVMHGAQDGVVAPWHSNEAVAALRENRVPVEYIVFRDEGHGWRKTPNRVRAAVAVTGWFEKWL